MADVPEWEAEMFCPNQARAVKRDNSCLLIKNYLAIAPESRQQHDRNDNQNNADSPKLDV